MDAGPKNVKNSQGVSIITCTNRQGYLKNLFSNYSRQKHSKKELIIIVNNDKISLAPYENLARKHKNVTVFRVPGHTSLGSCLNFAVKKAKYNYIAKFDDDDYYAPLYLKDSLQAFRRTKADVIGKRAHYMYLRGSKTLILRFPHDENRPVAKLPGATLVIRKSVLNRVQFPDRSVGEDDLFCVRSKRKGYKVYSAGKYNFVAVRRKNSANHTWVISDKELIAHHQKIPNVKNYKSYVQKKPRGAQ
ncbi:glycosyltransferase family 2 protein [Paenibacillus sp. M1]|uniref:Glycosyltransferase family 2 protein n=1 Tax=Paenibacillus haidiansis TaxID=1574488 RepID=A0ABU7VSJ5_9BACL